MHLYIFVVLLLCYNVLCISEECVTYNFEENQMANFSNTYGICKGLSSWDVGDYSLLSIDSPHRDSTYFIKPKPTLSCISSFKFKITGSGIFELNVFMKPAANTDQITLLVFQSLPDDIDATVGNAVLTPMVSNFVPGWQTLRVTIIGIGTHEGYITLLGTASESSTVLVDSFRYIGPNYDKDSCLIYDPIDEPATEKPEEATITPTLPTEPETDVPTVKPETTEIVPSTVTLLTTTEKTITAKPTTGSPTITISPTYSTTKTEIPVTTPGGPSISTTVITSTSTQRPRLFVSILLVKIKKFFR